ncbi:hypothetical protein ABBQ32_002821 [Trebouxia sp. C0010 RCD-2024]
MVDTAYPTDELSHPEYVNDDFRMFTFKVMKCPKRYVHDWRSCPFAHPTENARRRDPREVRYMPVPCPDYKRGLCLMDVPANGKQGPLGLQGPAPPPGPPGHTQDTAHMNYLGHDRNAAQAFHYQQQDRHQAPPMPDHLDPNQAPMGYPYPPAQHHVPYMDPYYAAHQNPNPAMDGYGLGMHMIPNPQMPNPNHGGFTPPCLPPGMPRMYPQPPRHAMEAPGMAGMPRITPYQREQQRLQSMHRYHSQQLSEQQQQHQQQQQQPQQPQQQQQQQQHTAHRESSGLAASGKGPCSCVHSSTNH